ncbi:hypothetical protein [Marinobacter similis]|uniref:Uncharacterized protein n=1 Tax=Marinobacter similis TaxID=1420916 RepID=W5YL08_9GAMM|nr:hypothetical protein [Marinobacter similis]AHI29887.1 hypothetical protein AU14_00300 [Marinobacter similis]
MGWRQFGNVNPELSALLPFHRVLGVQAKTAELAESFKIITTALNTQDSVGVEPPLIFRLDWFKIGRAVVHAGRSEFNGRSNDALFDITSGIRFKVTHPDIALASRQVK